MCRQRDLATIALALKILRYLIGCEPRTYHTVVLRAILTVGSVTLVETLTLGTHNQAFLPKGMAITNSDSVFTLFAPLQHVTRCSTVHVIVTLNT